jgi:hypothetical protein
MILFVIYRWKNILNHVNIKIDCKEETISLNFREDQVKFHFSKFIVLPYYRDLKDQEGTTIADIADVFYGNRIDDIEGSIEN